MSPKKRKLSPASAISIEVGANFGSFCNLIAHCSPTFLPIGDTCAKLSFLFFLFLVELENRLDPHLGNLFVQINLTQAAEFEKHSTIRFHKRINATSSWGGGSRHEHLTFLYLSIPFCSACSSVSWQSHTSHIHLGEDISHTKTAASSQN